MNNKPWLQKYPDEIPSTLTYTNQPVQDYLKMAAKEYPNKIAIHFMGKEFTYKQIYESSIKLAGYLQELGIKKPKTVTEILLLFSAVFQLNWAHLII